MERERWGQVEEIFHAALQVEESRRDELVRQSCAGDESLRREVESLLAHHKNAGYWDAWMGLAPDDSPLLLRDTGSQEIYNLNVQWP